MCIKNQARQGKNHLSPFHLHAFWEKATADTKPSSKFGKVDNPMVFSARCKGEEKLTR